MGCMRTAYSSKCLDLWPEVLGLMGASRTIPPACRNALALRKADAELAQGERRPTARRATSDRQGCRGGNRVRRRLLQQCPYIGNHVLVVLLGLCKRAFHNQLSGFGFRGECGGVEHDALVE